MGMRMMTKKKHIKRNYKNSKLYPQNSKKKNVPKNLSKMNYLIKIWNSHQVKIPRKTLQYGLHPGNWMM